MPSKIPKSRPSISILWPQKTSRASLQQHGKYPENNIALLQDEVDDRFEDLKKRKDLKIAEIEAEGSDIEDAYIVDARKEIKALTRENTDVFTVGEWEEDEEEYFVVSKGLSSSEVSTQATVTEHICKVAQDSENKTPTAVGTEKAPKSTNSNITVVDTEAKDTKARSTISEEGKFSDDQLIAWGIEAAQLLSDAFFFRCGFREQDGMVYTPEEWASGVLTKGRPACRASCLLPLKAFLRVNANLGGRELRWILSREVFRMHWSKADEAYRRQNPMAIPVWEIAIHLRNLFETSPDCEAEGIVLKMFRWLTGRPNFESACYDARSMTAKGIQNDLQLRPFLRTAIVSPQEQACIDRL